MYKCLRGFPASQDDKNRDKMKYYPRLLYCLLQMLAIMVLGQHRDLSFKTVRLRAPCNDRCMGTLLGRGLRFIQIGRTRKSVKKRDPICA